MRTINIKGYEVKRACCSDDEHAIITCCQVITAQCDLKKRENMHNKIHT